MDERQPSELRRNLFERRATRRALLAGGATIAAAGTAAAIIGVSAISGDDAKPASGGPAGNSTSGGSPTTTPAQNLDKVVSDPKRRAAHLLRRAACSGGKPSTQINPPILTHPISRLTAHRIAKTSMAIPMSALTKANMICISARCIAAMATKSKFRLKMPLMAHRPLM